MLVSPICLTALPVNGYIAVDKVIDILLVEGKCDPAFLKIFIEKVVPQITIDWMKTDTEALPRIA